MLRKRNYFILNLIRRSIFFLKTSANLNPAYISNGLLNVKQTSSYEAIIILIHSEAYKLNDKN